MGPAIRASNCPRAGLGARPGAGAATTAATAATVTATATATATASAERTGIPDAWVLSPTRLVRSAKPAQLVCRADHSRRSPDGASAE